jgi:hypothetical protein
MHISTGQDTKEGNVMTEKWEVKMKGEGEKRKNCNKMENRNKENKR